MTLFRAAGGSPSAAAMQAEGLGGRIIMTTLPAGLTLVSHHLCPYVQRAAIALSEKNIPFERSYIDLSAKPDWFLKLSPLGKVPLLIVRGADGSQATIFESNVICEYLEDIGPGTKLHPEEAVDRARHRAWMEFGSAILADLWGLETAADRQRFEEKRRALGQKFASVEHELGDGPFFGGGRFSLVDAVFAPIFRYFDLFDAILDMGIFAQTPRVRRWRTALATRPSVRAAVTDDYADRLRAFLRRHDAYLLKAAA